MVLRSIAEVAGNVSDEIKDYTRRLMILSDVDGGGIVPPKTTEFARSIARSIRVKSVDLEDQLLGGKKQCTVVSEITVTEDMVNALGSMHGGCTAFLVDVCTSLAIPAYAWHMEEWRLTGVSQSLSVIYHAPAISGDILRMVSTIKAGGKRSMPVTCEIWCSRGLVATGTHVKMVPTARAKL